MNEASIDLDHTYLSTSCFHDEHDYCKSMTGYNGRKRPSQCKFCGAKCVCWCHSSLNETTPPSGSEN